MRIIIGADGQHPPQGNRCPFAPNTPCSLETCIGRHEIWLDARLNDDHTGNGCPHDAPAMDTRRPPCPDPRQRR